MLFSKENVYLANAEVGPIVSGVPHAILSPAVNPWNDHSYTTYYDLALYFGNGAVERKHRFTKMLVENEINGWEYAKSLKVPVKLANLKLQFISQVQHVGDVHELVDSFGRDEAINLLRVVNDASMLRILNPQLEDIKLTFSDAFHMSIIRDSTPFVAFYGGPGFMFVDSEEELSQSFQVRFSLSGFRNDFEVDFDFTNEPYFKSRTIVLIGPNGSGKTQTLNHVVKTVFPEKNTNNSLFSRVLFISNSQNDAHIEKFPEDDTRNIFYSYDNLMSPASDERIMRSILQIFNPLDRGKTITSKPSYLLEKAIEITGCDDIILPLKVIDGKVKPHFQSLRQYITLRKNEKDKLELFSRLNLSGKIHFIRDNERLHLSTGQEFFMRILIHALGFVVENSLILFDEPETYLHPNLEVDFISLMNTLCEDLRSYMIISTHSVFMTREVPREQVRIFRVSDRRSEISIPQIQTFGAGLDKIANYVFGDLQKIKSFQKKLDDVAISENVESFIKENEESLTLRSQMYLINKQHEET